MAAESDRKNGTELPVEGDIPSAFSTQTSLARSRCGEPYSSSNAVGARGAKVVALGGGHGLYTSLTALKYITRNITAIVTVADDGGSSGRLRKELGGLPPGDLRMALSALCDDSEWGQTWRDVLQYRFASTGELQGHALGNLLIEGLWDLLGDSVEGLDWVGRLLNVRGRVLPMAAVPLEIEADVQTSGIESISGESAASESTLKGQSGGSSESVNGADIPFDYEEGDSCRQGVTTLYGQNNVAKSHALIRNVRIAPCDPPVREEALAAIGEADWIIFGPGSWYTSVIPHLLVPKLCEALEQTAAKRMLVLNLQPDAETDHLSAAAHILSFHERAPYMNLDIVLVDPDSVADNDQWESLNAAAALCGARLLVHPVADQHFQGLHDPLFLAAAYRRAFMETVGNVR